MYKQDPSITIKRLDRENCNDLPALYRAVYGRKVRAEYFVEKYSGYGDGGFLGYTAYHDEDGPIAFIGAVPCKLRNADVLVPAAQLTDGMTDPQWRGKGLFIALVETITALCREYDLHFLFGFPNQHSLPVFLHRLDWQVYGEMDHFYLPVEAWPLEKISRKMPLFKNLYRAHVNKVLRKYVKDAGADELQISILHAKIRARLHNGLAIGEMQVSENEFAEVMRCLRSLAKDLGVTSIVFHCSTGSELHRLWAENYNGSPSFTVICKDLASPLPLNAIKFSYADIDIFHNSQ